MRYPKGSCIRQSGHVCGLHAHGKNGKEVYGERMLEWVEKVVRSRSGFGMVMSWGWTEGGWYGDGFSGWRVISEGDVGGLVEALCIDWFGSGMWVWQF